MAKIKLMRSFLSWKKASFFYYDTCYDRIMDLWFFISSYPGIIDFSHMWVWVKLLAIIAMTLFNIWLGLKISDFKTNNNTLSGKQYRLLNEVPTVLLVIIIVSVVLKF